MLILCKYVNLVLHFQFERMCYSLTASRVGTERSLLPICIMFFKSPIFFSRKKKGLILRMFLSSLHQNNENTVAVKKL